MGVRIKAGVTDRDLPLVGNMRGHPGDKYVAVDVEAGVRPGENALGPFRAQQLLADKHRQDLAGKDLGETRVVDPRDLMEDARFVGPAFGHQKMEVHVEIDPVPEGLDGGDDPGRKRAPGHSLEVTAQGPEGAAAEVPQEPSRNAPRIPRRSARNDGKAPGREPSAPDAEDDRLPPSRKICPKNRANIMTRRGSSSKQAENPVPGHSSF
jgi:hypothetical protein